MARLAVVKHSSDNSFVLCNADSYTPSVETSKLLDYIRKSWSEAVKSRGGGDRTLTINPINEAECSGDVILLTALTIPFL